MRLRALRAPLAAAVLAALLGLVGCGGSAETAADERLGPLQLVQALQEGGLVVYLRHAATDRSRDDSGVVDVGDCSTQRNLSEKGRAEARALGRAFDRLEIPVGEIFSSEYCRTRETAELAFGRAEAQPDLTGFPNEGAPEYAERVRATRELLAQPPAAGTNTILVGHIRNIEAAASISIEEGDIAVFEPLGDTRATYLGSIPVGAWPQLLDELAR